MPNSLLSTASRLNFGSIGSAKMASSDSASRCRGPLRSTGVSLQSVGNPDVGHAGRFQLLADGRADLAAGDAVLDPEPADARVRMGQREAVGRLGMGEKSGIEIHAHAAVALAQSIQFLKCRAAFRCGPPLAAGLGVAGVQVQAVRAGDQRQGLVQVGPQLVGRAGLARIIAGDRQAAAQFLARVLESAHVVALPAVQRNGDTRQTLHSPIHVHAPVGILLPC